jgi:ABC-type nitrate/sulfonate/bicarbonate transport system ATPase subunit
MQTDAQETSKIEIEGLFKKYKTKKGETTALENISLKIPEDKFSCIIGPSGCGKTTLLNILAGLDTEYQGNVYLYHEGKKSKVVRPGPDRGVVFQQFALFPWKSVFDNVAFGLKTRNIPREDINRIVPRFINLVGLKGFERAYPKELSGGMKQRVAIARAYANDPDVFLMDEPFGALDAQTRDFMQSFILRILEQEPRTVIFITHSIQEAVFLADKIFVLTSRPGKIKTVADITLPRPRWEQKIKISKEFAEYERYFWDLIMAEQDFDMASELERIDQI